MAIPLIGVGGAIKAALINQLIGQVNNIALVGIVPTGVDGSGVSVSPNGKVTFTGATAVSVNGVFSASFDNYRIVWNSTTRSASGSTQFHLRGASNDVGSNYDYTKTVTSGTSVTATSSSSSSAIPLDQGVAAGQTSDGFIDLFGPALARATTAVAQSTVLASSALYGSVVSFANENASAYDGFSMYGLTSGQTWSGTLRVYGYNNLT